MEGKHNFTSFARSQGESAGILKLSQKNFVQGRKRYWKQDGVYNSKPRTVEELTKTVLSIQVEEPSPPISATVYPPYSQVQGDLLFRSNLSNYSQRIYIYWNLIQIKFLDVTVEGESFLHNQVLSTLWKSIWYLLTNLFQSFFQIRRMVGVAVGIALGRADLGLVDRFPSWLRQMLCCVCCVVLCLTGLFVGWDRCWVMLCLLLSHTYHFP